MPLNLFATYANRFFCSPNTHSNYQPINVTQYPFELVHIAVFTMKLYAVSDGPPSLACRMVLKALKIPFELVNVNFNIGEHLTEEYAKVNDRKY